MAVPPSVPGGNLPHSKDSVLCSFLLLLFLLVPRLRFPLIISNGFRLYCILYHIRAPLARGESKKVGRGHFLGGGLPCRSGAGGACPVGRLPTLPPLYPAGGLTFLSPACPAFSLLPCPLSPNPFPNGEGEIYVYFMQGAPPLASPGLSPSGAGSRGEPLAQRGLARLVACRPCRRCPRRGACLLCRLPTLPLACFPAPYPPAPSPMGKGRFMVISCKGLRPLHPQHLTACGTYSPCRTGYPHEVAGFF